MSQDVWDINLDYESINAETTCFSSGSLIHPYPAKAMPNMVSDLLKIIKSNYHVRNVLDPFCGSGTVGLESKLLGLDFFGSDLNPLAVLIARTKTLTIDNKDYVYDQIASLIEDIKRKNTLICPILDFPNIDYWFVQTNIIQISNIKFLINKFLKDKKKDRQTYALILLTAFSSTIREVCLSRNGEFKLYRIPEAEIENWRIDAYDVFKKKIDNLFNLLNETSSYSSRSKVDIYQANAKEIGYLSNNSINVVLTSPPYGDSKTTVAYGQFSRLPLQCIGDLLEKYLKINTEHVNCDELLLGGKKSIINSRNALIKKITDESATLRQLFESIDCLILRETIGLEQVAQHLKGIYDERKYVGADNTVILNRLKSYIKKKIEKRRVRSKEFYFIEANKYLNFNNLSKSKIYRRTQHLNNLTNGLIESHKNKISGLPNRKEEIINFFIDLYQVFNETDRVLKQEGLQGWIIGNRTVLGSINVPLSDILSDWFESRRYTKVTSLTRKYSFKRLPHHMNSALDREQKITSMMEEHIIVYQKIV